MSFVDFQVVHHHAAAAEDQGDASTHPWWAFWPTLFNYIIDWTLGQALQGYPGVQVGTNVHVSDLAYADDIVSLSNNYKEMQDLPKAVNHQSY